MDDARFLIVGANGQLGLALAARFPNAHKVDRAELDIADAEALRQFDWSQIDVILNAAAYTNVDGAETAEGRALAWQINAQGVANLARAAVEHQLTLIHVSTDYVFDGQNTPHTEDEPLTPLGVYGQSKAAGDLAASVAPQHYIVRTSWVIGEGKNFVRTMLGLAEKNVSPTVVSDQVGRLTFTDQLVEGIAHLLKTKPAYGVYNLSNDGEPASWAEVTRAIFVALNRTDLTVADTTTKEYFASKPGVAPRPLNSELNLDKVKATGLALRDWRADLQTYIANQTKKEQA